MVVVMIAVGAMDVLIVVSVVVFVSVVTVGAVHMLRLSDRSSCRQGGLQRAAGSAPVRGPG